MAAKNHIFGIGFMPTQLLTPSLGRFLKPKVDNLLLDLGFDISTF
jgi:hypothetical protein